MQVITLRVEDEAVDKIMELLSHLPKEEVKFISEPIQSFNNSKGNQPKDKLAGMFAHYVNERVTDEQIEAAITQGIAKRAMAGKTQ